MTTTIPRRAIALIGFLAMLLAVVVPQQMAFADGHAAVTGDGEACTLRVELSGYETIDAVLEYEYRQTTWSQDDPGGDWVATGASQTTEVAATEYEYRQEEPAGQSGNWKNVSPLTTDWLPSGTDDPLVDGDTRWVRTGIDNSSEVNENEYEQVAWFVDDPGSPWSRTNEDGREVSPADSTPNRVKVTLDGSTEVDASFGAAYSETFSLASGETTSYTIEVWDHDGAAVLDESGSVDCTGGAQSGGNAQVGDNVVTEVDICHATSSASNPYTFNTVDINSIIDPAPGPGHGLHDDDIIPPFSYEDDGNVENFAGRNWNDGDNDAIWQDDCGDDGSDPDPDPTVTVTADEVCVGEADAIEVVIDNPRNTELRFLGELSVEGTKITDLDYTVAAGDSLTSSDTAAVAGTHQITWRAYADYDPSEAENELVAQGDVSFEAVDCSQPAGPTLTIDKEWGDFVPGEGIEVAFEVDYALTDQSTTTETLDAGEATEMPTNAWGYRIVSETVTVGENAVTSLQGCGTWSNDLPLPGEGYTPLRGNDVLTSATDTVTNTCDDGAGSDGPEFSFSDTCVADDGEVTVSVTGAAGGQTYDVVVDGDVHALEADAEGDGAVTIDDLADDTYDVEVYVAGGYDGEANPLDSEQVVVDCDEEDDRTEVENTVYGLDAEAEEVCIDDDLREVINLELSGENITVADVELRDADGETIGEFDNLVLDASPHQLDWPTDEAGLPHQLVDVIVTSPQRAQLTVDTIRLSLDTIEDECSEVEGIVEEQPEVEEPEEELEEESDEESDEESETDVKGEAEERETPEKARDSKATLPRTGASTALMGLSGLLTLLTGGTLLRAGRRKQDDDE